MSKPEKPAYLAFDTSYEHGAVVLFSEGEILFSRPLTKKLSHGQDLISAIDAARLQNDEEGRAFAGLLCGLGPGSFIGVRLALSTALGYCFGQSLPLMGFCSHRALALSLPSQPEKFGIAMKASGELFYVTILEPNLLALAPTMVVNIREFITLYPALTVFTDQPTLLREMRGEHKIYPILGPLVHGVQQAAHSALQKGLYDQSPTIKPNYIKSPSVSVPKRPLVFTRVAPNL